jgi:hypothetical protein
VTKLSDWNEPLSEVEAMVRAAGQYVQVSRDLRPRVLETARTECGERRARRSIRQLAIVVVLLTVFATPSGRGLGTESARYPAMLAALDSQHIFSQAEDKVARGGERGWAMVEAFTDLRRQQASVLRLEL